MAADGGWVALEKLAVARKYGGRGDHRDHQSEGEGRPRCEGGGWRSGAATERCGWGETDSIGVFLV